MKLSNTVAAFATLAALASAAPIERREIKYVTTTVAVMKTDWVLTTVWVHPDGSPATPPAFTTTPVGAASTSYAVPTPSISSASVSLDPKISSLSTKPSSAAVTLDPGVSSVSTTPSSAAVTLDPSVTQPPAQVNAPAAPVPAPAPAPASVAPTSSSSGSSSAGMAAPGTSYTGQITYYEDGLGSCGITSGPNDHIVAISHEMYDAYTPDNGKGNPNLNSLCGKTVNINYNGQTFPATVVDRCTGCALGDLDLSEGFFSTVTNGNIAAGRIFGVTWEWAN